MATWKTMHKRARRAIKPFTAKTQSNVLGYYDDLKNVWGVTQLNKEQAISCFEREAWKDWTPERRGAFQLFQKKLCMPFDKFHEGIEAALCRPVWTHEFADPDRLRAEYLGRRNAPTIEQIIEMIPSEKRIIVRG